MQWVGGLGILSLGLILLPFLRIGGMQLFKMESSDRADKPLPRLVEISRSIIIIYVILSLACVVSYLIVGLTPFDALTHGMTTVATGGFSTHDESLGYFVSSSVLWVAIIFIIIGTALIGYLSGLFSIGSSSNVKPFRLGRGRIVGILFTLSFLYPITMSVIHPPTYHYDGMPRLMDEFIEALVPPPPTEDEIARKEGWFVDQYDEALEEAYRILNLDPKKKYTKEHVMNSYKKIMKKIHPDISPELSRLASIVNEAKDTLSLIHISEPTRLLSIGVGVVWV